MKALVLTINVLGFTALFLAYTMGAAVDRPSGVRRALQTYAGQLPTGPRCASRGWARTSGTPGRGG